MDQLHSFDLICLDIICLLQRLNEKQIHNMQKFILMEEMAQVDSPLMAPDGELDILEKTKK